ncbi:MAG: sugar phosphate isomerase/epimerase [Planctomycetaceae bacterium]|nr:sugar phosphate isomerase/epimerase [Planctomycetaceae bacterium]
MSLNRRTFMKTGALTLLPIFGPWTGLLADEPKRQYKVGICDWNLGSAMANPKQFEIAKRLGFQGVQLSYTLDGEFSLRNKENRPLFSEAAKKQDMEIASLAAGFLNDRPFAREADAESWVSDCLDVMQTLEVKQVLLAFFSNGELKNKPDDQKITIEKLKRLAPKAEKLGKILAVESYLNAEEHLRIIDAVGSDAVRIYYDMQNMLNQGYDIYEDMLQLGKRKLISQVHLKDDKGRLETNRIDWPKVKKTLEKIDYVDWLVVEGAVSGSWEESQAANAAYVRKLFQIE